MVQPQMICVHLVIYFCMVILTFILNLVLFCLVWFTLFTLTLTIDIKRAPFRGMCGHLFHLRRKCKYFFNWFVSVQNLLKLLPKDTKAINMRFYILCIMRIMRTKTGQCHFIYFNQLSTYAATYLFWRFRISAKYEWGSMVSSLQPFVEKKFESWTLM